MADFHLIWIDQCDAARGIKERFGAEKALGYLIGEKLLNYVEAAETRPEFREELPNFVAEVRDIFEREELHAYLDGVHLVRVVRDRGIRSIALPPLGCGSGGLEWTQVRREIEAAFAELPQVDVLVYAPTAAYYNAPKREGVEELTPARALIAELVRRYSVLGLGCTNLEVQKLAWFLQRVIGELKLPDPLDLRFVANKFGPYADRLPTCWMPWTAATSTARSG